MKKSKQSRISYLPLVERWEKFLSETGRTSVEDFAHWILNGEVGPNHDPALNDAELQGHFNETKRKHQFYYLSPEASFLLWKLYKFLRLNTKLLFREVGLNAHDEFAILAHLDYKKQCTKKAVIEENLIDLTTGVGIIKRLVVKGLVAEKVNPADRREKMLTITTSGRTILRKIYEGFARTQDLLADLDSSERERLVSTLKALERFHTEQHEARKGSGP